MDDMKTEVGGLVAVIIIALVVKCKVWILTRISPAFRVFGKPNAQTAVRVNKAIREHLASLLGATDASTTFLGVFHNGDTDAGGVHFRKFSVTHEVVGQGISSGVDLGQGLLLSQYYELAEAMISDSDIVTLCLESMDDNSPLKNLLITRNCTGLIAHRIMIHKSLIGPIPYGYVVAMFSAPQCTVSGKCELISKYKKDLEKYAGIISVKIGEIAK